MGLGAIGDLTAHTGPEHERPAVRTPWRRDAWLALRAAVRGRITHDEPTIYAISTSRSSTATASSADQ
jgi:hypothetical protein